MFGGRENVMKFDMNEIKKTLTKAVKKTKETSGTVVEIAKLKYKLAELKSDIDEKFKNIGKFVYNAGEDEDITEKLKELCLEIAELSQKKDDMQENLNELTNKKLCPGCNTKFEKEFGFCPKCGYKFDE